MADLRASLDFGGSLPDAAASLARRATVASPWRTREWEALAPDLREAAFFSASVESARFLSRARERLQALLDGARRPEGAYQTREKFVAEMMRVAREEGLVPADPSERGGLRDPSSERRLGLIWDMQVRQAQALADHRAGLRPGALLAFPAQELVRVERRAVPRDWPARWRAAGGRLVAGGRMVALKSDPVWERISRFGRPWPPFDFGSGMGLRDISRREAVALGVLDPSAKPADYAPRDGAARLAIEASAANIAPDILSRLMAALGPAYSLDKGIIARTATAVTSVRPAARAAAAAARIVASGLADSVQRSGPRIFGKKIPHTRAADLMEAVSGEWERLKAAHPSLPDKPVKAFFAVASRRGLASLDGPAPAMSCKSEEWDEAAWENIARWEAAHNMRWGSERKGKQVADNFRHEMAHVLSTPQRVAAWDALVARRGWTRDDIERKISKYGGTANYEAIAEAFGIYTRENYTPGDLDKDIEDFVAAVMLK